MTPEITALLHRVRTAGGPNLSPKWEDAILIHELQFDIRARGHNLEILISAHGTTTIVITDAEGNYLATRKAFTQLIATLDAWLGAYAEEIPA